MDNNSPTSISEFSDAVRTVLKQVKDPELKLDIIYLGLVRNVEIKPCENNAQGDHKFDCEITMTLTSAGCPFASALVHQVEYEVSKLEFINSVKVHLELTPPWQPPEHIKDLFGWS